MPVPTVRLKIWVKLSNGSRAYVDPVFSSNNKLKPLYALVDGKPRHHPEGVYHLRYMKRGKRVWEDDGLRWPVGRMEGSRERSVAAKLQLHHRHH